jgi:lipopolysaccharide transport system permease protein
MTLEAGRHESAIIETDPRSIANHPNASLTVRSANLSPGTTDPAPKDKAPRELVIEAGRRDRDYWMDLWRYRELFRALAWRDVSVRYKQTVIGAGWALIRPLLAMVVFTVVFGKIARLPSEGVPYPLLVFVGMLPWMIFSTALSDASSSLVSNANLISKVYFPRLIVPAAAIIVSIVDFLISLILLMGLLAWFAFAPSWRMVFLPGVVLLGLLASAGPALWITAVNVKYRDFRYVIPFLIQFGLYASPVGFSSDVVPAEWHLVYSLNPMVGVIDGFRWCILGVQSAFILPNIAISVGITIALLAIGLRQFRKMERSFADLI